MWGKCGAPVLMGCTAGLVVRYTHGIEAVWSQLRGRGKELWRECGTRFVLQGVAVWRTVTWQGQYEAGSVGLAVGGSVGSAVWGGV